MYNFLFSVRMTRLYNFLFPIVCLCAMLASCDEYCDRGTTTAMVVSFCIDDEAETPCTIRQFEVCGIGQVADSSRLTCYESTWLLPLSNRSDTTRFALSIGGCNPDTLVVVAARRPVLVSDVCGCATLSTIDTAYFVSASDTISRCVLADREFSLLTFSERYRYVTNLKIFL